MRKSNNRIPFKYNIQIDQPEVNWEEDFLFDYRRLMDFQLKNISGHYKRGL